MRKKGKGGEKRERERGGKGESSGHTSDYRTALACSNERKSICMIHARESVPKRVGGGRAGGGPLLLGEQKDGKRERGRERGQKKVV